MSLVTAADTKGVSIHITIAIVWPTPTGLGAGTRYAKEIIVHGGECALAAGIAKNEMAKVNIRNIAIAATILSLFISFSP
jgi:hypothetical protein